MKALFFTALAAGCVLGASAMDIRMYSGQADTVSTATQMIVGATEPGATVTINGQAATTNRLGSFAMRVDLNAGPNAIEIKAAKDGAEAVKNFSIFRREEQPRDVAPERAAETVFATPFFVESGEGAYLQYGNGDDRLGGSKMGFIAPGIPLKVVGQSGDLYKVALSATRWAYIPKEYTERTEKTTATVITGSWSISNQGRYDRVSIALPERLPYYAYTLLEPSTIVLELFGAMDNSNWMVQRSVDLGMVDYAFFEQTESDVYKVVIRLKEKYQWGYTISYEANTLCIDVRHCPSSLALSGLKIGLDAGHGGRYPGAYSPSGLTEKEVNLDIILRLGQLLSRAGATVVYTREGDTGPSMTERKRIFREAGVDLAISVHNNWTADPLSSPGTSAYYKHLFDRPLAETLVKRMLETGLNLYGLTGNFNFSLNGPTDYPNALIEAMFINSLEEEEYLADPDYRQRVAEKIFAGIKDYIALVKSSRTAR